MYARLVSGPMKFGNFNLATKTLESEVIPLLRKQRGFKDELSLLRRSGQFRAECDRSGAENAGRNRDDTGLGPDGAGGCFHHDPVSAPVDPGCRGVELNRQLGPHAGDEGAVALLDHIVGSDIAILPDVQCRQIFKINGPMTTLVL